MADQHRTRAERKAFGGALPVLVLLRRRQLGEVARQAERDPVGAVALICLAGVAVIGLRLAVGREPPGAAWRFGRESCAAAIVASMLRTALIKPDTARLVAGPLHPMLAQADVADRWTRLQVYLTVALPAALLALLLLPDLGRVLMTIAAVTCGLAATSAFHRRTSTFLGRAVGMARRAPSSALLSGPLLIARVQSRGRRRRSTTIVVSVLVLILGSVAARLALANNSDPKVALAVLAAAALTCGGSIGALDVELLRFLGRTPMGLGRLVAASCLPAAALAAIALAGAGLLIGLDPVSAVGGALAVFGCLAAATGLVALHALAGPPRFAHLATAIDLALVAAAVVTFAPAAPVWIAVRTALLWRGAQRGRWLVD